jgi:hypothetical protein
VRCRRGPWLCAMIADKNRQRSSEEARWTALSVAPLILLLVFLGLTVWFLPFLAVVYAVLFVPIILYVLLIEASRKWVEKSPERNRKWGPRLADFEHLSKRISEMIGGIIGLVLIGSLVWNYLPYFGAAQISEVVATFRNDVAGYVGETATRWLFLAIFFAFVIWPAIRMVGLLVDKVEKWIVALRERKAQAETEREEQQAQAEWKAFENWVKQNPVTADRLMRTVEFEQIKDPERLAWVAEHRESEGPSLLDLMRLFDWLKAHRDLKKIGIDPPPPQYLTGALLKAKGCLHIRHVLDNAKRAGLPASDYRILHFVWRYRRRRRNARFESQHQLSTSDDHISTMEGLAETVDRAANSAVRLRLPQGMNHVKKAKKAAERD